MMDPNSGDAEHGRPLGKGDIYDDDIEEEDFEEVIEGNDGESGRRE